MTTTMDDGYREEERLEVWLARDPYTGRISMQTEPFGPGSFPPGVRGRDWPTRSWVVAKSDFEAVLAGTMGDAEVDEFHLSTWSAAEES